MHPFTPTESELMSDTHEVREAREREARSKIKRMVQQDDKRGRAIQWLIKLLDERIGKQGETIHSLRADLAETRELHSRIERNDIRQLDRQTVLLLERVTKQGLTIDELREKLRTAEEKLAEESVST